MSEQAQIQCPVPEVPGHPSDATATAAAAAIPTKTKKCNSVSHLKKGELTSMQIRKEAVDAMVVTASSYNNVCVLAMSAHEKTSTGKGKNVVLMEIVRALNCNDQFLRLHDALPANSTGTNKLHRWLKEDLEWFRNTNLHNGNQPFAKKSSVPEIADLTEQLTLTWNDTIAAIDQKQVWNSAIGLVWLLTFLFLQQAEDQIARRQTRRRPQ